MRHERKRYIPIKQTIPAIVGDKVSFLTITGIELTGIVKKAGSMSLHIETTEKGIDMKELKQIIVPKILWLVHGHFITKINDKPYIHKAD